MVHLLSLLLGLVFVFFCVPDTTGRNLEQINRFLDNPAFSLWRHAYITEQEENEAIATMPEFKNGQNGHNKWKQDNTVLIQQLIKKVLLARIDVINNE